MKEQVSGSLDSAESTSTEYDTCLYSSREFSFIGGAPLPHKHIMTLPLSKNALCCFSALIGGKGQCLAMQPENCWKRLEQLTAERAKNYGIKAQSWLERLEHFEGRFAYTVLRIFTYKVKWPE